MLAFVLLAAVAGSPPAFVVENRVPPAFEVVTRAPDAPPPSVVRVSYPTATGGWSGSGTVVWSEGGRSVVLTNAHVADRPDAAYSVFSVATGKSYPAKYLAGSKVVVFPPDGFGVRLAVEGPDLALLVVEAELPAAKFAPAPPKPGAGVRQWGFGGRTTESGPSCKAGEARGDVRVWYGGVLVVSAGSSLRVQPGDSGSGVFDANGDLVGVTHGYGGDPPGLAVPLVVVKAFVTEKAGARFPRFKALVDGVRGLFARLFRGAEPVGSALAAVAPRELPKAVVPNQAPAPSRTLQVPPPGYEVWLIDGVYHYLPVGQKPAPKSFAPPCPPGGG
jgi:S1-C subfamily serine protease